MESSFSISPCFPVILGLITVKSEPPWKPCLHVCQSEAAKTRPLVCVCDSVESHNQKTLSFNLCLLIIGRLLSVLSL